MVRRKLVTTEMINRDYHLLPIPRWSLPRDAMGPTRQRGGRRVAAVAVAHPARARGNMEAHTARHATGSGGADPACPGRAAEVRAPARLHRAHASLHAVVQEGSGRP